VLEEVLGITDHLCDEGDFVRCYPCLNVAARWAGSSAEKVTKKAVGSTSERMDCKRLRILKVQTDRRSKLACCHLALGYALNRHHFAA
jgi:hypothetical protein